MISRYLISTKNAIMTTVAYHKPKCILIFWGKKIFIVSKQKNRQKLQKIDIYNIHKLYTK